MRHVNIFSAIFLPAIIFVSCSGSSATNLTADSVATASANTTSSGTDASFSCMLDGKEFSGKGTDQNFNAAFHLTGDDKGQIFFKLSDINNIGNKLMFQVAAKEGSTTFSVSPTYSYGGYTTSDFTNYIDDPVTVVITSISASRVSGTFSGKYTLQKGSGNASSKQTIQVIDGKFDIPFSTSADWKQLYHAE